MRLTVSTLWLVAIASPLVLGCSSAVANQLSSAGRVGCYPKEIVIEQVDSGWGGVVWTASCRGREFVCTGSGEEVDCTELLPAVAVPPADSAPEPPPAAPVSAKPAPPKPPPPPRVLPPPPVTPEPPALDGGF